MLVLSRSLLNREYVLIIVLKALALIISMCNLHVTFLSKESSQTFRRNVLRPSSGSNVSLTITGFRLINLRP
jgi:hypothetical protein